MLRLFPFVDLPTTASYIPLSSWTSYVEAWTLAYASHDDNPLDLALHERDAAGRAKQREHVGQESDGHEGDRAVSC